MISCAFNVQLVCLSRILISFWPDCLCCNYLSLHWSVAVFSCGQSDFHLWNHKFGNLALNTASCLLRLPFAELILWFHWGLQLLKSSLSPDLYHCSWDYCGPHGPCGWLVAVSPGSPCFSHTFVPLSRVSCSSPAVDKQCCPFSVFLP